MYTRTSVKGTYGGRSNKPEAYIFWLCCVAASGFIEATMIIKQGQNYMCLKYGCALVYGDSQTRV